MTVHSPYWQSRWIRVQRECHPSNRQTMPGRLASPAIFQAGRADMKPISLTVHGAIDYLAVVIFAVAPAIIGLSGLARSAVLRARRPCVSVIATNARMISSGPTIRSTHWCSAIGITLVTPAGKSVRSVINR